MGGGIIVCIVWMTIGFSSAIYMDISQSSFLTSPQDTSIYISPSKVKVKGDTRKELYKGDLVEMVKVYKRGEIKKVIKRDLQEGSVKVYRF